MSVAQAFALFCLLSGGNCIYDPAAHITTYWPAAGGINGSGDYTVTASGREVEEGVTAACGPGIAFGTKVYVGWFDSWFTCWDRGSAIEDGEVDVMSKELVNVRGEVVWVIE